jgi:hypothetical protein
MERIPIVGIGPHKLNIAAIVSHTHWFDDELAAQRHRIHAVDGTSQEAEAIGLLVQLQEIISNDRTENWIILDSMACVHMFIAACGGDWGPVIKRGLASYALIAKEMLDRIKGFICALRQSSHSWSVSNRACDLLTSKCPETCLQYKYSSLKVSLHARGLPKDQMVGRLLRKQLHAIGRRALAARDYSGWFARLDLDPSARFQSFTV